MNCLSIRGKERQDCAEPELQSKCRQHSTRGAERGQLRHVTYLQTANFVALGRASVRHCTQKGLQYEIGLEASLSNGLEASPE